MASIIYEDTSPPFTGKVRISDMDPIKAYLKHYSNLLYLEFILRNSQDRLEKHRAAKEVLICQRKLNFWQRHPNWDTSAVASKVSELKTQWKVK